MANQTGGNPYIYDATTGASWTGEKYVLGFQWIDDAADIADDDDIVFVANGVTFTAKIQLTANTVNNVAVWEMWFPRPVAWNNFSLTTLDHGAFIVWLA